MDKDRHSDEKVRRQLEEQQAAQLSCLLGPNESWALGPASQLLQQ